MQEVDSSLAAAPLDVAALSIHLDFVFLGRSMRHAFEAPAFIRLVRRGSARWRGVGAREYCEVDGRVLDINNRVLHEDHKGLSNWVEKQNRNATREARVLFDRLTQESQDEYTRKTSERRWRAWIRERIWNKMPLFIRPLFYFGYRYILRGGFLDGYAGLAYTFLQGFWLTFLIDAKYYEFLQQSEQK